MSTPSETSSPPSSSNPAGPGGGNSSSFASGDDSATASETAAPSGDGEDFGNAADSKKRRHSPQDKLIQACITDSKVFLKVAAEDAHIRPLLEARGVRRG